MAIASTLSIFFVFIEDTKITWKLTSRCWRPHHHSFSRLPFQLFLNHKRHSNSKLFSRWMLMFALYLFIWHLSSCKLELWLLQHILSMWFWLWMLFLLTFDELLRTKNYLLSGINDNCWLRTSRELARWWFGAFWSVSNIGKVDVWCSREWRWHPTHVLQVSCM